MIPATITLGSLNVFCRSEGKEPVFVYMAWRRSESSHDEGLPEFPTKVDPLPVDLWLPNIRIHQNPMSQPLSKGCLLYKFCCCSCAICISLFAFVWSSFPMIKGCQLTNTPTNTREEVAKWAIGLSWITTVHYRRKPAEWQAKACCRVSFPPDYMGFASLWSVFCDCHFHWNIGVEPVWLKDLLYCRMFSLQTGHFCAVYINVDQSWVFVEICKFPLSIHINPFSLSPGHADRKSCVESHKLRSCKCARYTMIKTWVKT